MTIVGQQTFSSQIADDTLYWYQIESYCTEVCSTDDTRCCDIGKIQGGGVTDYLRQGQKFLRIVAARGLDDLNDKINSNYLLAPLRGKILSIKRSSHPVYPDKTVVAEPIYMIEEDVGNDPAWGPFLWIDNMVIVWGESDMTITSQVVI